MPADIPNHAKNKTTLYINSIVKIFIAKKQLTTMPYNIILGRDAADKKKFGDAGLIYLGKGYVTMGNYTSLSNNLYLDVARSHVVLVAGKRGSGKSYTLGVITEEISN